MLDQKSEKYICKTLKRLLDDKTAIIITHRKEILKICNKIIDLDKVKRGNFNVNIDAK